eukprot:s1276_g8.t1
MLVTHLASVPPESPSFLRSPWTSVMVPVICNDTSTSTAVVRRTTASELSGAVDAFSTGYRRYFVGLCNRSYTIPDLYEVFAAHSVEWAILGKTQAWWSVISVKELEGQRDLPKEQKQRFYASGIDHRDLILRDIEVNGTRPLDKTSSVLDFGCGVGRLGMAFARKFAEVTCVDQSVFHLQIAKLEWQNQKQANPESHLSYGQLDVKVSGPDLLAAVAGRRFDFVYSMIVLQHMVMKYYGSGDDLAKDMGIPLSVIEKAHEDHYQAAKMMEKDPEGGKWPAIHPPDVIGKYAPDSVIGMIGGGGGGGGAVAAAGGAEFRIHPPDVIGKYAPDSVIGKVGSGAPAAAPAAGGGLDAPLLAKDGHKGKDWSRAEKNREQRMKGEGRIPGWIGAIFYMVLGFMKEILFTIVPQSNVTITGDRVGLTRSAMFLFIFIIIHAVGNLHVFLGPDDFNGYGYFYVRLYWTGFGFQANIVEEYILLAALLHVFVALKRTWDISMNYSVASGKLNLAFSGVTLLTFMMLGGYRLQSVQAYRAPDL